MKRLKQLALVSLAVALLSQIPFAYRRYKLGRLNAAIQTVNSERKIPDPGGLAEYVGVVHVHSFLGGHSTGSFSEIISAAQANKLQFVIMTEHAEKDFDTAEMTLKGLHAGVLFVNGNEVAASNGDRLLVVPGGASLSDAEKQSTKELANNARAAKSLTLVAYPEQFKSWDANGFDGVEVYNVYSNARRINPVIAFFDALWSHRSYPDLLFANFYEKPTENLRKWDEALTQAHLSATAGNDAHANIGISLNDSSGNSLLGLRLDPYETSFRLVRMHVLIPRDRAFDTPILLNAIKAGHCFIGFDLLGDTTGFRFEVDDSSGKKIQGDEVELKKDTRLIVDTPVASRILLFKDGNIVLDESTLTRKEFPVTERGVYRVEIYLPQLSNPAGEKPWIISNPIYVK
jgi:hypothetical protein